MGLAGAGLFSLGLADLAYPKLFQQGQTSTATSSTSIASSTTSSSSAPYSTLTDYQDFLSWLHSVSGPYSGKTIDISLEAEFGPYATQLIDNDFLNASGIRDKYNIVPYALQLDDISLMSSTQSSAYDCYSLDVENLGVFPTLPISPYELAQEYPNLTYPNIDFEDFHRYSWDRIATYPPDLSGGNGGDSAATVTVLPFDTPTLVLFYRQDIYNKLGLTPPATWDDHFANCQAIQKSGLTPFGSVSMAGPAISVIYEYQAHLASFGGSLWAVDGSTITPTFNTDAGVAALEDYVRFQPLSDPGSSVYTWDNVFDSLSRESAAQGLLFDGYATWLEDPLRSNVTGLISYATNPAGPQGSFHPYAGSGVGRLSLLEESGDGLALGPVGDGEGNAGGQDARRIPQLSHQDFCRLGPDDCERASDLRFRGRGARESDLAGEQSHDPPGVPEMAPSGSDHRGRPERGLERDFDSRRGSQGCANEGRSSGDADLLRESGIVHMRGGEKDRSRQTNQALALPARDLHADPADPVPERQRGRSNRVGRHAAARQLACSRHHLLRRGLHVPVDGPSRDEPDHRADSARRPVHGADRIHNRLRARRAALRRNTGTQRDHKRPHALQLLELSLSRRHLGTEQRHLPADGGQHRPGDRGRRPTPLSASY